MKMFRSILGVIGFVLLIAAMANAQVGPGGGTGGGGGGGGGPVTQATSPWVDNISQWGGANVASATAYGTPPSGSVPGVNAYVSNFPATQAVSWTGQTVATTQSGPWTVAVNNFPATQVVSGTVSVSNFPATQPVSGTVNANLYVGNAANTASNPAFTQETIGGAVISPANPAPVSQQGQVSTFTGSSAAASAGIVPVVASNATAASVKTSAGNLYSVYARNLSQTQGFLLVYNAAAAPASGATLASAQVLDCVPLAAATSTVAASPASLNYLPGPAKRFSTGIQVLISSTDCAAASPVYTTGTVTAFISAMGS